MKKFGFGIIGYGLIAKIHAKAIENMEDAKLVGVVGPNIDRCKKFAAEHKIKCYKTIEELLDDKEIDIVNICTPSGLHAKQGIMAAKAGKHLIVEKPIDVSIESAENLIEECEKNNVKLAAIFQQRFFPTFQKLHQIISENKMGKLTLGGAYIRWYREQKYYSESSWHGRWALDGGGALINQSIHYIDLLQWMMGEVEEVSGYINTLAHDMEAEDVGVGVIKFKSGALGVIEGTTAAYPGFSQKLEIYGEKGAAIIEDGKIHTWKIEGEEEPKIEEELDITGAARDPGAIPFQLHRVQFQDLIDAIKQGRDPIIDGREGLKALKIVLGIYNSHRFGKPIKL